MNTCTLYEKWENILNNLYFLHKCHAECMVHWWHWDCPCNFTVYNLHNWYDILCSLLGLHSLILHNLYLLSATQASNDTIALHKFPQSCCYIWLSRPTFSGGSCTNILPTLYFIHYWQVPHRSNMFSGYGEF